MCLSKPIGKPLFGEGLGLLEQLGCALALAWVADPCANRTLRHMQ